MTSKKKTCLERKIVGIMAAYRFNDVEAMGESEVSACSNSFC